MTPCLRPSVPAVLLAHELLDNLPFRRFRATAEGRARDPRRARRGPVRRGPRDAPGRPGLPGQAAVRRRARWCCPPERCGFLAEAFPDPHRRSAQGPARDRLRRGARRGRPLARLRRAPPRRGRARGARHDRHHRGGRLRRARRTLRASAGSRRSPTVSQRDALDRAGVRGVDAHPARATAGPAPHRPGRRGRATWGDGAGPRCSVDPAGLGRFRWFVVTTPRRARASWMRSARALGEQRLGAGSRAEP